MFNRNIEPYVLTLAQKFPVLVITGPRQSGKTTLIKKLFPDKPYVNLEDLGSRQLAQRDPKAFLSFYAEGVIIDEVQYVPELFSYIQVRVDEKDTPGEFILSGSQNFLMMDKVTQSLAGRVGIIELLPLSYDELRQTEASANLYELMIKGCYPRLYKMNIDPTSFYQSYIQTYVERDIRQIQNIGDLDMFQRFMRLCAARIGQLLNMTALASECGISLNTAKSWLSILKTSYIVFTLPPYFKNFNKRLVKMPKLYFYDTGLASALLEIRSLSIASPIKGSLFENWVVVELIKAQWNKLQKQHFYFWRDNHGHEVDVVFEQNEKIVPIEIKANETFRIEFLKELEYFQKLSHSSPGYLIYAGSENLPRNVMSWKNIEQVS